MWIEVFEHGLVLDRVLADVACDGGTKFHELPINPIGKGHPSVNPTWLTIDVLEQGSTSLIKTAHGLGSISFPVFCQDVMALRMSWRDVGREGRGSVAVNFEIGVVASYRVASRAR